MFRYMTGAIYFRIQAKRGWLLEIDGERRTMFRMGPVHARDNGPGVSGMSQNVPLGTGTYCMPEGLSIRPNMNRVSPFPTEYTQGITAHPAGRQGCRGTNTPHENTWWPPGRISGISCTTYVWPT